MAHLTVAVSERAFQTSLDLLKSNFRIADADSVDFGPFRAGYSLRAHLEGGSVDIRSDGSVQLSELDLRWDQLQLSLGLDIPEICVGGGCINMPWPIPDICLPRWCLFEDDPDVSVAIDLAPFVAQEVSLNAALATRHWDPGLATPQPLCDTLRGLLVNAGVIPAFPTDRSQWHVHLVPGPVDIDLFDFPDIVGNLIENALTAAVAALIPGGWVRDLLLAIIGSIADLIRAVLDIPDDIEEWLSDLFNISFGLLDMLVQAVSSFFAHCVPIYRIDDPFTLLEAEPDRVAVQVPINQLGVAANDDELILTAQLGV
ncbi:MAG TPA: hypothetical protein PLU79_01935 [Burkholderiaceae bacterium]|nr:hypothetical protein [Burkholderiaceae bacterium]